jgi:hypothetical protein
MGSGREVPGRGRQEAGKASVQQMGGAGAQEGGGRLLRMLEFLELVRCGRRHLLHRGALQHAPATEDFSHTAACQLDLVVCAFYSKLQ